MQEQISAWCDPRFWVSVVAAAGTLGAVTVALFLRELRAWVRPPKLNVDLSHEKGLFITSHLYPPGQAIPVEYSQEKSRYYHLKVDNPRRKADAVHGVTVALLGVEKKGKDGQYHPIWTGDIPMAWRNDSSGVEKKIVGTWAESDLCSVVRDKFLQLHIRVTPIDLQWRYDIVEDMPVDIVVTVQARGNEVDSAMHRWRIFWDGKWEDGDLEMQRHFHVTPN